MQLSDLSALSESQREMYLFVRRMVEAGTVPTYREIQARFEMRSVNAVVCTLRRLQRKGFVKLSRSPRGLRVVNLNTTKDEPCAASAFS